MLSSTLETIQPEAGVDHSQAHYDGIYFEGSNVTVTWENRALAKFYASVDWTREDEAYWVKTWDIHSKIMEREVQKAKEKLWH